MTATTAAASQVWDVARAVAAHDLRETNDVIALPSNAEWPYLLELLSMQRLCGVALHAVDAGLLELTDDRRDELFQQHEMQLAIDLRIERVVIASFDALTKAHVDARLLKGAATAHRFYPDPALRSFGDADILVPQADFATALRAFGDLGFRRKHEPPRPWFDRYIKAACLIDPDGLEVDLHQMLAPGPYGVVIGCGAVFCAPPDRILIGQHSIDCLSPTLAFIHACVHAALGDPYPRFVSVRDIAQIARGGLDEQELTHWVREWQLQPVVSRALSLVDAVLGVRVEDEVVHRYRSHRPSRRDQWRLASYQGGGSRFAGQSAATLWELRSFTDKVAYAFALALPARSYLAARNSTYPTRLWRAATLTRAWRRR